MRILLFGHPRIHLLTFLFLLFPAIASAETPTFSSHVASIVYNNCAACHREGGGAPFSFTSYEGVSRRARLIADVTQSGQMPPWLAVRGEVEFHNERGLTPEEVETLRAWAAAGAPLGDADAVPPAPVFESEWFHGTPDILLEMEEDVLIPADGPDIYRNFVVRIPDIPEGKYLYGIDYRPKALQSSHHALFSLDTSGDMRRLSEAEPRPGFGGMEANFISGRIGGWAVGAQPEMFPKGVSLEVAPGTDIMVNAHYRPVGKAEVDRAQIALYLTDQPPTRQMYELEVPYGFGIPANIRIPPGEANYVLEESFSMPVDTTLYGIVLHAHLIAKEIKVEATFPDGRHLTLINVPEWNFAWQEQYYLKHPLFLPEGTRVDCTFIYDNSADNPYNPNNPPKQITWGPSTDDEMACVLLRVVTEHPEQMAALKKGYADWVKESFTRTNYFLIARSIREQERDRLDIDGDGRVSWSEALAIGARIERMLITDAHDELGIGRFVLGHIIKTKVLPLIAFLLALIAVAVWWRRRTKQRRGAELQ